VVGLRGSNPQPPATTPKADLRSCRNRGCFSTKRRPTEPAALAAARVELPLHHVSRCDLAPARTHAENAALEPRIALAGPDHAILQAGLEAIDQGAASAVPSVLLPPSLPGSLMSQWEPLELSTGRRDAFSKPARIHVMAGAPEVVGSSLRIRWTWRRLGRLGRRLARDVGRPTRRAHRSPRQVRRSG
jgi:hypothetical protein